MSHKAKILALKMGETLIIETPTLFVESGWRIVLSVQSILAKVQSTVFFGNDLLIQSSSLSSLPEDYLFRLFLQSYYNTPQTWLQLRDVPPPPRPTPLWSLAEVTKSITQSPVSSGQMTLLSSGYNPVQQYWLEFSGNYFLTCPIFKDWQDVVVRDGPNFKGFVPSS